MDACFAPHLQSQRLLQAQCQAGAATNAPALAAFLHHLSLHRDDLLLDLFPALREAMAGSDAVCIREMQARASGLLDALEVAWRCAPADAAQPCAQLLAFENTEVLAMAERLLDDGARGRVGQALRARRAAA